MRTVIDPIRRFVALEAASGIVLLAAALVALAWANSGWSASYGEVFTEDVVHWINDALMAVFFLVVGLEIKREWVAGELRDRRAAALPVVAALGGMLVPAAIYVAINAGGDGAHGWGIPMATDIAFALGVVAVVGRRVPPPLKVFLLTLAIVDDIGAIVVIAVFYSDGVDLWWLAAAAGVVLAVIGLRRARVTTPPPYVALGLALWVCVYESGVHATIAGVAMGLLLPADRNGLIDVLHPWTSYLIVPLFALANAGVALDLDAITSGRPVVLGVVVGLVVGKVVGITGASWLATRVGLARLPAGVGWGQVAGLAGVAGIGFTVSLFVAGLAFDAPSLQADAKVGVLVASTLAAAGGSLTLVLAARRRAPS